LRPKHLVAILAGPLPAHELSKLNVL